MKHIIYILTLAALLNIAHGEKMTPNHHSKTSSENQQYPPIIIDRNPPPIDTEAMIDKFFHDFKLDVGSDKTYPVFLKPPVPFHGICIGTSIFVASPFKPSVYLIIDKEGVQRGEISYFAGPSSSREIRRSLCYFVCSTSFSLSSFGFREERMGDNCWALHSKNSFSLGSINNIGFDISIQNNDSHSFRLMDQYLAPLYLYYLFDIIKKGKVHSYPMNVPRANAWQKTKIKESEEWKKKRDKEREKQDILDQAQGLPSIFLRISEFVFDKDAYLPKATNIKQPPQTRRGKDDFFNLVCLDDILKMTPLRTKSKPSMNQGFYLMLSDGKKGSNIIHVAIGRFETAEEAKANLVQWRYYDYTNHDSYKWFPEEEVKVLTRVNPRKVGDFDLGLKHRFAADGSVIPKSNESAIYFVRGDTVVVVASDDIRVSVMALAQSIDALLIKKFQALEKEQNEKKSS